MKKIKGFAMNKKILFSLPIILFLVTCTKSAKTPASPPLSPTTTPTLSLASNGAESATALPPIPTFTPITRPTSNITPDIYAVIQVAADDVLNIRSGPGMENPVVGTLQPDQSGLKRTGQTSRAGEELWVEIQNPAGGTGWVNAKYLTEYASPDAFCADTRVTTLLQNLEMAVNTEDSELFKSLVSPAHGLDVKYIRSGIAANYMPEEASWAFQSTYVVNWGAAAGSGQPVSGTFPEIVLPALQDVFKNVTMACNEIKLGGASYVVEWPAEYANFNYYSLYNPGNDPSYNGMDWRTWLVGVEYVNGQPYLFALMNYQWEP